MSKVINLSLALVAATFLTGCLDDLNIFKKKQSATTTQTQTAAPVSVGVIIAKKADNRLKFEYPARIQSQQDVTIVAKVSGTLIKQNFKPGDMVKKGDVLFKIDPETYEAVYEAAQANILQAEATLKNAKREYERVKNLLAQKAISQKEYDSAAATFESATANLASAKASAKTAKLNLNYTDITAPFSGVVSENLVDVGAYIIASNTSLVRLVKTEPIEARFYIADTANMMRLNNLNNKTWEQVGTDANLSVDGENFIGKVTFIDNIIDSSTGRVLAKAEFENKDGKLLDGMFAKLSLDGFVQKDSFLIPQIVIKQNTTNAYVLVIKDGKVAQKDIDIKFQTSSHAVVGGLDDGDVIIKNNFNKIAVGAPVSAEDSTEAK